MPAGCRSEETGRAERDPQPVSGACGGGPAGEEHVTSPVAVASFRRCRDYSAPAFRKDSASVRTSDTARHSRRRRGRALVGHELGITCMAFSPDNHWVVTGSNDSTARLWDLKAADPAAQPVVLKGHEKGVNAVAFSPDNRWVVTGSDDTTARLLDLKAADPAAQPIVLKGHEAVTAVAFSPDNRWVVAGSGDRTARLWDLKATDPAVQPVVLTGHEDRVTAVAISPDNRWVVTGSDDSTARLWDLKAAIPPPSPSCSKAMTIRLRPWPSARTTVGWSLEARTAPRGCGI